MLLTQTGRFGWDPFAEMRRLQTNMNRVFDGYRRPSAMRGYPPVSLWEGDDGIVLTAELPGFSREDIDMTVRKDAITLSGKRASVANDNARWHRRERGVGTFTRTVELPFGIDPDTAEARLENGVLEVRAQRPEAGQPRRIEIKG